MISDDGKHQNGDEAYRALHLVRNLWYEDKFFEVLRLDEDIVWRKWEIL